MNEKVFRDPVHNYITVNHQIIYDLINSKEFQRLRRVKQVSTTVFTFHGAEHSRFSHCLGVYEIARRVTEIFDDKFPDIWNSDDNLLTMVAGLLHDVGHGAYSHTFEKLFDTDHEAVTQKIITSPDTEVNTILRRVSPDFQKKSLVLSTTLIIINKLSNSFLAKLTVTAWTTFCAILTIAALIMVNLT